MNNTRLKVGLIVVLAVWAVWSLIPTYQLAQIDEAQRAEMDATEEGRQRLDELTDRAIKQGLDLKGGMYLVLEVDTTELDEDSAADAIDRVVETLRRRVDQFGVSEPVIQKETGNRIILQLPGIQDAERAKRLIGRTAKLEFRLIREGPEVSTLVERIDRVLAGLSPDEVEALADSVGADAEIPEVEGDAEVAAVEGDSLSADLLPDLGGDTPEDIAAVTPEEDRFGSLLGPFISGRGGIAVSELRQRQAKIYLAREDVQRVMPRDVEFLWGTEELEGADGNPANLLFLVEREIQVSGEDLDTANISPDPDSPGFMQVNLVFNRRGGLKFANATGANVNRKLGIVLDGGVASAPNISGKISGGNAVITGNFRDEEANDLALVLRAGALPADVIFAEERTVGPSLGRDSIRMGTRAMVVGTAIVIVFLLIYYQVAGVVATSGLLMTLLLLAGILAQFKLTLTLPGIAGIVLTVGMAVDANVLIFERIREELRHGLSVRASIDGGYANATRAIVDANVTTLIAAVVLYLFGTGPIQGFAVTLAVGIATSMFSALIFTRTLYEVWLGGRTPRTLSI